MWESASSLDTKTYLRDQLARLGLDYDMHFRDAAVGRFIAAQKYVENVSSEACSPGFKRNAPPAHP